MAGDVKIGISVDASDANAGLKSISKNLDQVAESVQGATNEMREGLDDAATAADNVAKKLPKAGAVAKKTGDGLKGAASSAKGLGDQLGSVEAKAGKSASVMAGLSGALSIVSPEAGEAAASLSAAAGGIESLAKIGPSAISILGPVALAAGAGALAFAHFSNKLKEAEARVAAATAKLKEMQTAFGGIKTTRALVSLELAVAKGEKDASELVAFKAKGRAEAEFSKPKQAATERLTEATGKLAEAQRKLAKQEESVGRQRGRAAYFKLQGEIEGTRSSIGSLTAAEKRAKEISTELTAQESAHAAQIVELSKVQAAAAKKSGGGGGSRAKARRAEEDRARMAQLKAELAAIKSLQKAERSAQVASLEGEAKILAVSADRVDSLNAIAAEHTANAQVSAALESATAELTKSRDAEIAELRAKDLADLTDARAKRESDAQKQHEDELTRIAAEASARRQAMAELTGNTSALFAALSDNVSGMDREMATRLFNVSKGFTVAQIGFSTAEGLMTAAALPPPVDAIKAAAVIAQAGASLAMVSAQKPAFHTGTGMVQSPGQRRELNARLRAGEAVSTPLGSEIIGRDNIERANAGMSGGGGSAPVVFQYEHRVFSRFIRDNARMRGPLSSEINRGKNSGHRG